MPKTPMEDIPPGYLRFVKTIFYILLGGIALAALPGIPPTSDFKSFKLTPSIKLEGLFKPQYVLDKAVKLSEGEFKGTESIVLDGKKLYFGTDGGRVIKLEDNDANGKTVTVVAQYEKPCEDGETVSCGTSSPLGIRFDSSKNLVIIDGKYGIVNVNPKTGSVKYHVTMKTLIDGVAPGFPDDLDVGKDGSIYWSDLYTGAGFSFTDPEDANGRLIKTNPKTGTHEVLVTGLGAANGVQLSEKEDFVLVTETFKSRVIRYYLKGPKAGTSDIFVDGLPGLPDNVRPNGKGGYYVALFSPRCFLLDGLGPYPVIRKLIGRLQMLSLMPLALLNNIGLQNYYLSALMEYIFNLGPFGMDMAATPMLVDLDAKGTIQRILTTQDNTEMVQVTQITIGDKYAYMGGFSTEQIWKIALEDLDSKST